MNVAYNMDCLEAMKEMPDNAYDLACVDPPYGAGLTENGGCKGWFSKYHQTEENRSQTVNVERERERRSDSDATAVTDGIDTAPNRSKSSCQTVTRTGGTWATKYAKKS